MDIQILNFVNIKRGHIVPATAPGDDPKWIECIIEGAHMIISKDLTKIRGVDWHKDLDHGLDIPNGTKVIKDGSFHAEYFQAHIFEVAPAVAKALRNLG